MTLTIAQREALVAFAEFGTKIPNSEDKIVLQEHGLLSADNSEGRYRLTDAGMAELFPPKPASRSTRVRRPLQDLRDLLSFDEGDR